LYTAKAAIYCLISYTIRVATTAARRARGQKEGHLYERVVKLVDTLGAIRARVLLCGLVACDDGVIARQGKGER